MSLGRRLRLIALSAAVSAASAAETAARDSRDAACADAFTADGDDSSDSAPGYGLHIWPASFANAPRSLDRLAALKPRHLRFALGPNWARKPPLAADMTDRDLDSFVARGLAGSPFAEEIAALRAIQQRVDARFHLVVWAPPPLPSEPLRPGLPGRRRLNGKDVAIAGRFLVALLKRLSEQGFTPDAVELSNEPDGDWNLRISPENYVALLEFVRAEAKRRHVSLPRLHGPGTSDITALRRFFADADKARALTDLVDVVSVHGWDGPRDRDRFLEFETLRHELRRFDRNRAIVLTEFGLARPDPGDGSAKASPKKRAPNHVADTEAYGTTLARDALRFFAAGAGAIIQWEFQDQTWGRSSFGLVDEAGVERPSYRILALLMSQLSASGASRILATPTDNVFISIGSRYSILWISNATAHPVTVPIPAEACATTQPDCAPAETCARLTAAPWSLSFAPIRRH